ncbi:Actin-related protein 2/3 complex subunit 1A [Myotis davidii]|uniref:Actin-related protein 2/3 complex subunit 1A n=1 Tax=Myotis davidii TaxID=225400 RepID=L5M465_MYODS|nr:Actin-related protein 2/3 complex subunit 1A [Myotis davidii]
MALLAPTAGARAATHTTASAGPTCTRCQQLLTPAAGDRRQCRSLDTISGCEWWLPAPIAPEASPPPLALRGNWGSSFHLHPLLAPVLIALCHQQVGVAAMGAKLPADRGLGAAVKGARQGLGGWAKTHPCAHRSLVAHRSFQENSVLAARHDCCPMLFSYDDRGCLTLVSQLDIPKQSIQHNMDKRATTEDCSTASETLHQHSITQVSVYEVDKQDCRKFCTTGIDGAMSIWDFKTLEFSIQRLRII